MRSRQLSFPGTTIQNGAAIFFLNPISFEPVYDIIRLI
jgi:hypothetical protein